MLKWIQTWPRIILQFCPVHENPIVCFFSDTVCRSESSLKLKPPQVVNEKNKWVRILQARCCKSSPLKMLNNQPQLPQLLQQRTTTPVPWTWITRWSWHLSWVRQEQLILQESNFNIQNATTSTIQHFHFHGNVNFFQLFSTLFV